MRTTVPLKENYNPPDIDRILKIGFIIVIGIAIALASCNPYKKLASHPPKGGDTALLLKEAVKYIPKVPPKVIPGKTIRVPYKVDKLVIDKAEMAKQIARIKDSLTNSNDSSIIDNTDDYNRMLDESYQTGYNKAKFDLSKQFNDIPCPPDTCEADARTLAELAESQTTGRELDKQLTTTTAQRDVYKKERNTLGWLIALLLLIGGTVAFFKVKKSLSPTNVISKL